MKRILQYIGIAILTLILISIVAGIGGVLTALNPQEERLSEASIMALDLEGVIIDGKGFLELLRKYRKEDKVKGILIRIASPGGVVGPSQELYEEIKRTREQYHKPVYAFCSSVAASGAYYAAVAADKIYTTPGCMVGSIGALMEFINLEKLYDWAKIHRYSITTGKYKDAGAEYKPLAADERALFQDMLNDVLRQFKEAIVEGRHMKMDFLDKYADGRIFTGAQAVKMGFADQVGTWDDALSDLGKKVGLGESPEVFKPHKPRGLMSIFEEATSESKLSHTIENLMKNQLAGQPLFIFPGAARF